MNKTKKIVVAAVSVVMAGSMALSFTACKKDSSTPGQEVLAPALDENGKLTWDKDSTKLNIAIGHNNKNLGAALTTDNIKGNKENKVPGLIAYLGGETSVTIYGKDYAASSLKPAWAALETQLGVKFTDKYTGQSSDKQLQAIKDSGLENVDIFTSSAADLNNEASQDNSAILNLANYLDYMPNYKAFLETQGASKLSLTANATGAMYMAPYYDGNDDIEKYVLLRKDIVEDLLNAEIDGSKTVSYKAQSDAKKGSGTDTNPTLGSGTQAYAQAFMGSTNWNIKVTDPSKLTDGKNDWGNDKTAVVNESKDTIEITVDYTKALADAKSTDAGTMGSILSGVTGVAAADISGQTSGNIVDIMNLAINKSQGEVKGDVLVNLLKRYIEVTYRKGSDSFYTTEGRKLADVFNSAYAAWDVDLYTALGRCFVTSGTVLGEKVKETKNLYLLTGRERRTDRFNDTVAMAGELYGVRGLESRYQYSYVNKDGDLVDARTKTATFDALNRMSALTQEGLYAPLISNITITGNEASHSGSQNKGVQTLSLHDYVQTQTAAQGFRAENTIGDEYNFAPVLTPVSNWDTDDNGEKDKVMRFTESWRSVKTTGFAISYKGVSSDPKKLSAALAFVDYMFSNDGQILMTYGPQSKNGKDEATVDAAKAANGGFWYATEKTDVSVATVADKVADATNYAPAQYTMKANYKAKYFIYNEKVYEGTLYGDKQIPTVTPSSMGMFHASELGNNSFTNYARYVIGTTLPIGNKDQGFEYQCTAKCGLAGADIVAIALNNGTVEHPLQQIPGASGNAKGDWYSIAPVTLSYESDVLASLSTEKADVVTGFVKSKHIFDNSKSSSGNFWHDIMTYGLGSDHVITLMSSDNTKLPADAAGCVSFLDGYGMGQFNTDMNDAFQVVVGVYVK